MAQVSIQYALDHELDAHDVKQIKQRLDEFQGVESVALNQENGILCVDFNDRVTDQRCLEQCLRDMEYRFSLIDSIIIGMI